MSISVVINTCDAEDNLEDVLKRLRDFDEVIVCDMHSTDRTREIAEKYGCRIITHERLPHKEPARDYAIRRASNDWVLVIDSDEIVTSALTIYLHKFAENPGDRCGLYLPRRNYMMNRFRSAMYPDYKLRFFRKSVTKWPPEIHSQPIVKGKVGKIPANRRDLALIHIPVDLHESIDRINRYSTIEAENFPEENVSMAAIIVKPWITFIKGYFLHGGFTYGMPGYVGAVGEAIHHFMRLAKIYESRIMEKFDISAEEKIQGNHS